MTLYYLMLVDIVGYSKAFQDKQVELVTTLLEDWSNSCSVLGSNISECTTISIGDGFIAVMPNFDNNGPSPINAIFAFLNQIAEKDIKLHIGLHFGACEPISLMDSKIIAVNQSIKPNNYLGYNVNYVARLASCAKPGQVIASSEFITICESFKGEKSSIGSLRWDEYIAAFKGDIIHHAFGENPYVISFGQRSVAPDERRIFNLMRDGKNHVHIPPDNVVSYTGRNNYHSEIAFHASNFQLAPDVELFSHYFNEQHIAKIAEAPFFSCLPYSVLYSVKNNGKVKKIVETRSLSVELKIDTTSLDVLLGEPRENAQQCCLRGYKFNNGTCELLFSRCYYKESRASNMAPDRCDKGNVQNSLRRRLLNLNKGSLPLLDSPYLTNNIGVSAIVISRGQHIILQERGDKGLHSNINSWSVGASGAVDWTDYSEIDQPLVLKIKSGQTTIALSELKRIFGRGASAPDRGILRECAEEIALLPNEIESIQLVGIAREFRRLGKPEFFYVVRSNLDITSHQVASEKEATYRWEYDGKKLFVEDPLPPTPSNQIEYLANRICDHRFNEITRMAFYFMLEELLFKKTNNGSVKSRTKRSS